jgi:hypothetical protein
MHRIILLLLSACLLAVACDKVKDRPAPDPLQGLELKPLQIDLLGNSPQTINLTANQSFPSAVTVRIVQQPANGSISLDSNANFVFTPDPGFFGSDSSVYEICSELQCIQGLIRITITDTTQPCTPSVPDFSLEVQPGTQVQLNLPSSFGCGAGITALLANGNTNLSLQNGKVFASFPENEVDTVTFAIVSCNGTLCDTGKVRLVSGRNYCIQKFQLRQDTLEISRNFREISINYNFILKNDSFCTDDPILDSLILGAPSRGIAFLRKNVQGRFVRYVLDSTFTQGMDSFSYTLRTNSGTSGTSKVFIKIK